MTVLTSMEQSDLAGTGIDATPAEHALRLATLTQNCGLDGVVCSAHEAKLMKETLGGNLNWSRRGSALKAVMPVTSAVS